MNDQDKKVIMAARWLSDHCKTTGCMYCIFHKRETDELGLNHDRCVLGKRPSEWQDEIEEDLTK